MLRICEKEDLNPCVSLFCEVFTSKPWDYHWMTPESMLRYFTDLYMTPGFIGYMYYDNNRFMGACMGCVSDYFLHSQYEIKEIFVDIKEQHKGVGSAMIKEIETDLIQREIKCITLITQRNIPAYAFYKKHDFHESEQAVHFAKILTADIL